MILYGGCLFFNRARSLSTICFKLFPASRSSIIGLVFHLAASVDNLMLLMGLLFCLTSRYFILRERVVRDVSLRFNRYSVRGLRR